MSNFVHNWQVSGISLCFRKHSFHFIQTYVQSKYLETKMQKFSSTAAFQLEDTVQSGEGRKTSKMWKFSKTMKKLKQNPDSPNKLIFCLCGRQIIKTIHPTQKYSQTLTSKDIKQSSVKSIRTDNPNFPSWTIKT